MRPVRLAVLAGAVVASLLGEWAPAGSSTGDEARGVDLPEVHLDVSNFRYCPQAPCGWERLAYLRGPAGPLPGTDRPDSFVTVAPGSRVTWTYRDETCDLVGCAGHEVRFEDGSLEGTGSLGFMPSGQGPLTLTWTVPANARPGSLVRYFCAVETHWKEGLTGVLRVSG